LYCNITINNFTQNIPPEIFNFDEIFPMQKLISYPISIIYYLVFGLLLCVFHPIQWICLKIGYQAHKKSVDVLNFFLVRATHLLGTTYQMNGLDKIPNQGPIIFVANHQSLYDIPAMIWFFRKAHPKFISKKELGKGIPSVSFNLKYGGSVLIDRKDGKQAIAQIEKMAKYIQETKRAVVIFPEGTRSRNGQPKKFQENGLKTLFTHAKYAWIVPVTIQNSWKMVRYGSFPMGLGSRLVFEVHEAYPVHSDSIENLIAKTEQIITQKLNS